MLKVESGIMMKLKKLLIFDVYGTIISTGTGSIDATKKILSLHDKEIDSKEFYAEWKKLHRVHMDKANEGVFITEEEIFVQDLKVLYEKYGIERDYRSDVKIMLDSLVGRVCFEDVKDVLDELKANHRVVLGTTTDTTPLLVNLKDNGLEFEGIYTSEIIRKYKPDERFYKYILEHEHYDVKDVVFIGDSIVDDIIGPKSVGIKTVLVDRTKKYKANDMKIKPDYIINDFKELFKIYRIAETFDKI